jgi:acetylornithine deacetylase
VNPTEEKVLTTVDSLKDDMVAFLQDLVRHPSTLGIEKAAQEVVFRKIKSLGLSAEIWEPRFSDLAAHPAFGPVEWGYTDRPNVTGTLQGQGGGRSLALNGHIDVVSPEPIRGWTHDPWGAEIVGNRMYGRGTLDMKCGIAMCILAIEALQNSEVKLKGNLYFETVLEEECGGNGALACRIRGHAAGADAAIVAEPTGLTMVNAELGVMWFRVRVRGTSGHVAVAQKIPNVIESCFSLIQALHKLEADMNKQLTHPLYLKQEHPLNLNIGVIEGGHWPSSVPVECSFVCRLSYEPGVSNREMRTRVEACLYDASHGNPEYLQNPPEVEYFGFQSEGDCTDMSQEYVKILGAAHKVITGKEIMPLAMTGTTDMRSFNLYSHTPAAVYGPNGQNPHTGDEFVEINSIVTSAKTLALFIINWCGIAEG